MSGTENLFRLEILHFSARECSPGCENRKSALRSLVELHSFPVLCDPGTHFWVLVSWCQNPFHFSSKNHLKRLRVVIFMRSIGFIRLGPRTPHQICGSNFGSLTPKISHMGYILYDHQAQLEGAMGKRLNFCSTQTCYFLAAL